MSFPAISRLVPILWPHATRCRSQARSALVEVRATDKLKKADAEEIVSYLDAPSDTTVLALVAEKLPKNTRLYKAVAKHGASAVIDCAPVKHYQLPKMVRSMAVGHGVTLTEGAAAKLVELVGEDTVRLDGEVGKDCASSSGRRCG